jgi:hypothetical protein
VVRDYWAALAVCAVVGMATIGQLATANTLTQALAPDRLQGRAVSLHMFAMAGLHPFGAGAAGALGQRLGVSAALMFGAVLFLLATAGIVARQPSIARLA